MPILVNMMKFLDTAILGNCPMRHVCTFLSADKKDGKSQKMLGMDEK